MKSQDRNIILWVVSLFLFASCIFNKEVELYSGDNITNEWTYRVMKTNYLWLEDIGPSESYSLYSDPESFFYSLLSNQEKKMKNNKSYWYSYIEKSTLPEPVSRLIELEGRSYGMELGLYPVVNSDNYYARILYVVPGSPAARGGIERGMWILKMNGNFITPNNYKQLLAGDGGRFSVFDGEYSDEVKEQYEVTLSAAEVIEESPILKQQVLNFNGCNVAYLCYNHFSTGPGSFEDKSWDEELKRVFENFRAQNVRELVLDLRFNRGGYLACAHLLSSMIVPERAMGEVFCNVSYHPSRKQNNYTLRFDSSVKGKQNLNLDRVYVLTSATTASSSEVVMNSLSASGIMSVIQIGTTTEGKNVGSEQYRHESSGWILHPIVASISNKDNFGDYKDGFIPTSKFYYDELSKRKRLGELGTTDDYLLALALNDMGLFDIAPASSKNGSSSSRTNSRSDDFISFRIVEPVGQKSDGILLGR